MEIDEKRGYPRLTLAMDDGYFGKFSCHGGMLVAQIMNISAGGLNMTAPRSEAPKLEEGGVLLLESITGGANLSFLSRIEAEIRWIKPLDHADAFAVGCRFVDLPEEGRAELIRFVDAERLWRGQYE